MSKRASEAELGKALRSMDLEPYVYRLPDPKTGAGVSNWKPCDFMVWWEEVFPRDAGILEHLTTHTAWIEAKDTDQVNAFPRADLRQSQIAGIRHAARLALPFLLAVYWRRAKRWTISNGVLVLQWFDEHLAETSIPRELLMSRFGVDAEPRTLAMTIKTILEDGW